VRVGHRKKKIIHITKKKKQRFLPEDLLPAFRKCIKRKGKAVEEERKGRERGGRVACQETKRYDYCTTKMIRNRGDEPSGFQTSQEGKEGQKKREAHEWPKETRNC